MKTVKTPWVQIVDEKHDIDEKKYHAKLISDAPQAIQFLLNEHKQKLNLESKMQRVRPKLQQSTNNSTPSNSVNPFTLSKRAATKSSSAALAKEQSKNVKQRNPLLSAIDWRNEKKPPPSKRPPVQMPPSAKPKPNLAVVQFPARLENQSLKNLKAKYVKYHGRCFENPNPSECDLPVPITRAEAYKLHSEEKKIQIGVSQIIDLSDDIWLFGRTNSCATVALLLTGFHPFFFISCAANATQTDADALKSILNHRRHWPKHWRQNKKSSEPVVAVTIETRLNGVIYQGRDPQLYMRINFANTSAFRHYRQQLALPDAKSNGTNPMIHIGWRPRLFHEEHTWIQMFFNSTDVELFGYVEVSPQLCRFLPPQAWDELQQIFDAEDDRRVSDNAEAEEFDAEEEEPVKRRTEEEEHEWRMKMARLPRTKAHLEGKCEYAQIISIKTDNSPPMVIGTFDIETLCWDTVVEQREQLAKGFPPPAFDDDIDLDGETCDWSWAWTSDIIKQQSIRLLNDWKSAVPSSCSSSSWKTSLPSQLEDGRKWLLRADQVQQPDLWMPLLGSSAIYPNETRVLYENLETHQFMVLIVDSKTQAEKVESLCNAEAAILFSQVTNCPIVKKTQRKRKSESDAPRVKQGQFPIAKKPHDAVFLIATQFSVYGDKESFLSVIHSLGHCDFQPGDLPDTVIYEFDEATGEKDMLEHWSTMVRHFDLEWLAGYNSISYDLPYIFQRAKFHKSTIIIRNLSRFQDLPHERKTKRFRYRDCLAHEQRFGNHGINLDMPVVETPGMLQFDAMRTVKLLSKLNTYSLKEVAAVLLKGKVKKKDLAHELISPFWASGPVYRRRLAIYNYYDVKVTLACMNARFLVGHVVEVSRASFTSVTEQMFKGAQCKVWNLIVHYAHRLGWILDEQNRQYMQRIYGVQTDPLPKYLRNLLPKQQQSSSSSSAIKSREKKYAGAYVLPPKAGFYLRLVHTFDFASLYPSIMDAFRLCFSTVVDFQYDRLGNIWFPLYDKGPPCDGFQRGTDRYVIWDVHDPEFPDPEIVGDRDVIMVAEDDEHNVTCCFVQNRGGILGVILRDMVGLRKVVKKELELAKAAKDDFQESVLDARQGAIKVICNATYGFTGAEKGYFALLAIAITTCIVGRIKIMFTKEIVETDEEIAGEVIYGDTDSVFVTFPKLEERAKRENWSTERLHDESQKIAKAACQKVTSRLPQPMKLEFEKTFSLMLLIGKKQYAGNIIWPEKKIMTKGTANVRRDICELARECIDATFKAVVTTPGDRNAILAPLQKACDELADPNLKLERLERTVAVKSQYKNDNLVQCKVFKKMETRRGTKLDSGTRVPYIISNPESGKRLRRKNDKIANDGEDITYMRENNILPDRIYYLNNHVAAPLRRYLSALVPEEEINKIVKKTENRIMVQTLKMKTMDDFVSRNKTL